MQPRPTLRVPGWFIALTVLVTGALTAWAVMRKRSGNEWPGDPTTMPQRLSQALTPAMAAPDPFQRVAATRGPSVIRAGTPAPHPDRGTCTICHIIVDRVGAAVPAIRAMSLLPHPYRGGICTNCHQVTPSTSPLALPAAAALAPQAMPPLGLTRPAQPREGAWLGMEVVPITAMTAAQYRLPAGLNGLVIAEAEGAGAAAGLRAGDVLAAVNGTGITDMQSFLAATQGQTSGTVDVLRGGKILRAALSPPATTAPALGAAPAGWPAPATAGPAAAGAALGPPPMQPY